MQVEWKFKQQSDSIVLIFISQLSVRYEQQQVCEPENSNRNYQNNFTLMVECDVYKRKTNFYYICYRIQ